jgi:hypothetical protein
MEIQHGLGKRRHAGPSRVWIPPPRTSQARRCYTVGLTPGTSNKRSQKIQTLASALAVKPPTKPLSISFNAPPPCLVVTARDKAQKKLSNFAKKSFSTTWKVLHEALCNWLKDGHKMKHPCLDKYNNMRPGLRKLLETALKNQDTIGWKYAMRGYFSTSWVDAEKHFQNGPSTDLIRQTRLKTIIFNNCGPTKTPSYTLRLCHSANFVKAQLTPRSATSMNNNRILRSPITFFSTLPLTSDSNAHYDPRNTGLDLHSVIIPQLTTEKPANNYKSPVSFLPKEIPSQPAPIVYQNNSPNAPDQNGKHHSSSLPTSPNNERSS